VAVTFHRATLYDRFEPPERLTLVIEAMARDDAREAERLQRTCPRFSYTGPDVQFTERYTLAFDIMAVVTIDLRCVWGKLQVMRCVLGGIRDMAVAHKVTAALAFIDGSDAAKGCPSASSSPNPCQSPRLARRRLTKATSNPTMTLTTSTSTGTTRR
jgi:hypothetical protein